MIRKRHKTKQELASRDGSGHRVDHRSHEGRSAGGDDTIVIPPRKRLRRWLRYASAGLFLTVVVMVVAASFLYFAVQGRSGEGGAFKERFEAGIQELIGPQYSVSVTATDVAFNLPAFISIRAEGIELSRANGEQLAQISAIDLETQTASLFSGALRFGDIAIEELRVSPHSNQAGLAGLGAPKFISERLSMVGTGLAQIQDRFDKGLLDSLVINALVIESRQSPEAGDDSDASRPNRVTGRLALSHERMRESSASAELVIGGQSVFMNADYRVASNGTALLSMDALGIETASWFPELESKEGGIALDSTWAVEARLPFDRGQDPEQALIRAYSIGGKLRLGNAPPSALETAELNLRFIPEKEQLELERSSVTVEGMDLLVIGGLKPKFANEGFHGPLEYELIAERAIGRPTLPQERPRRVAMSAGGFYEPDTRQLEVEQWFVADADGRVDGTAMFDFSNGSPAVTAEFEGKGLAVATLKQFWPVFIARGAREWVRANVSQGEIASVSGNFAIPSGIIGNIRNGARFSNDQLQLKAEIAGTQIVTFGDLPPLRDAELDLAITGMGIKLDLAKAVVENASGASASASARVRSGRMRIDDFAEKPAMAKFEVALDGEAKDLFEIASAEPLNVAERSGLDPAGFTGRADVDVVATLPLKNKLQLDEIRWNALAELQDFASSKPILDRTLEDGDLVLDITGEGARINGRASIDGVPAELALVEPFGSTSSFVKKRDVAMIVNDAQRKALGVDLSDYVTGPMTVRISSGEGGGERFDIDLTKTELSFAATGWQKGAGIAGKASFTLMRDGNLNTLKDFAASGGGMQANGTLAFDKTGLLSADLKDLSLNNGDLADLAVSRSDGIYRVNLSGTQWDGRGILNTLFHLGGFKEEQGGISINFQANLGKVIGFQNQHLANVLMTYKAREGFLRELDLKGALNGNRGLAVKAKKEGLLTLFDVSAGNAGVAFGFADIYRRMEGGRLEARLTREGRGAFTGPIVVSDFTVVDEPRLEKLVASRSLRQVGSERREFGEKLQQIATKRANFIDSRAIIEKGDGYFKVKDGVIRGSQLGFVFDGTLYDTDDRMDLRGTFMPAFGLSLAVSAIPFVGELLSNGRDGGLIGITYKLSGKASNPTLQVNPISLVAPGVFNKVFEFRN